MVEGTNGASRDAPPPVNSARNRSRFSLSSLLHRWDIPEDAIIIGSAVIVGIGTGLSAALFNWATFQVRNLTLLSTDILGLYAGVLASMIVAGLLVGLMVRYWAPEVRGSGVPEVIEAVALRGGRIRRRVAVSKIVATSLTVGSGGSAGREGPIVLVGSAIGSTLGQSLRFSERRVRTLAACGAAGGIAAVFGAPIAGTLFAMEVILDRFTVRYFGAVVISAVAASITSEYFLGRTPAFETYLPAYPLFHVAEIPVYAVLGVLAAVVAVLFTRARFGVEGLFTRWGVSLPVKAATGMAIAGALGLVYPEAGILGSGLPAIGRAIADNIDFSVQFMLLLLALKVVATSFTIGSGNSGGIFAPSLYMGAVLGGIVGEVAHGLWPAIAPNPAAYAIVGMAAVFSGAARAPITSILIVFEMTGDYKLILPLMLATVLSTLLAEHLLSGSIYTLTLKLRGITLEGGRDVDIMEGVTVEEVMSHDFDSVDCDTTLEELSDLFSETHRHGFPILDRDGKLCGIVSIGDLDRAVQDQVPLDTTALEIGTPRRELIVVTPQESMGKPSRAWARAAWAACPSSTRTTPTTCLASCVATTSPGPTAWHCRGARTCNTARSASPCATSTELSFPKLRCTRTITAIGRRLSELSPNFPEECILVSIRRCGRLLIPHGDTVFQAGDRVTVFVNAQDVDEIEACLRGNEAIHGGTQC